MELLWHQLEIKMGVYNVKVTFMTILLCNAMEVVLHPRLGLLAVATRLTNAGAVWFAAVYHMPICHLMQVHADIEQTSILTLCTTPRKVSCIWYQDPVLQDGFGTANTALIFHAQKLLALHEGDLPYAVCCMSSARLSLAGASS